VLTHNPRAAAPPRRAPQEQERQARRPPTARSFPGAGGAGGLHKSASLSGPGVSQATGPTRSATSRAGQLVKK
jgi:hypothetical protein